ncbi:serine/threonine-protein kinase [Streptomyces sp. NPDC057939]|uniref:serine/threonine-protein kinase n=1 Tax=Streptomyces sp. NPDC057939 TaxID=3346284 RepID=UPI0036E887E2
MRAGDRLADRYELVERIGAGGMGEVWRSLDQFLQRPVAVKVIRDDVENPVASARFRREATIGARLRHPGITVVHDIGRDGDRMFIVMELLEGIDLAALIAGAPGGLPVEEVVALAVQVAEGLAAAHEQGVVHRDLKPANLFLHDGQVKICDFGIARATGLTAGLTGPHGPGGTALYMAPEQWRAEQTDERCDLYAFGCVLYQLLTGTPPFTGQRYVVMRRHIEEVPRSLRTVRPDAPPMLEALVAGLLEKSPRARPSTAGNVLAVLTSLAGGPDLPTTDEARTAGPGQDVSSSPPRH